MARFAGLLLTAAVVAACDSGGTATFDEPEVVSDLQCVADAQATVAEAKGPFHQEFPTPFDGASAAGKTFWIISITQAAPSTIAQTEGFEQAAQAVGAEAVVFDGKGNPDLLNQGVNTAVSRGAAGIVLQGFEPSLVRSALANAQAQSIPVVHALGGLPEAPSVPGVTSTATFDATREGTLQAAYAALETGCNVKGVMFYSEASAATDLIAKGAQAELDRLCPRTCSLDMQNVEVSTFATELTSQTQNVLQRSPGVNFILTSSDSFVSYILAGTKSLGRAIPVVGATGQTLAAAQAGSGQVADILWPPLRMCGYLMFDAVLRATGGRTDTPEFGLRLVDKDNWGESTSDESLYPELSDYPEKFKEIWGVGVA